MAQVVVNEASLSDIAQALRTKLGTNETFKPSQMGDGVRRLPSASSAPVLITKQISANGTYAASGDNADGYSSVEVSVANSYSSSDEGKVVDNGALVSQTSLSITSNDTYDTTKNNEVVVNVANSYSASDEGKVVDNGALVAQTTRNITQNGTYDTTKNDEVVVNVSGGGGGGTSIPSFENSTWFFTKTLNSQKLYSRIGKALDRSNYSIFSESTALISEITFADLATLVSADMFHGIEHYDYVNSDMITALGLVELGRDLANGSSMVLSDSIANYSAIVAQGVYQTQTTSQYNTTIIYHNPQLNTQYWTGMKDRNISYDRYFAFTSNTDVTLSGGSSNRGIILWGMP